MQNRRSQIAAGRSTRTPLAVLLATLLVSVAIAVTVPVSAASARASSRPSGITATPDGTGYLIAHADGRVSAHDGARHHGDMAGRHLNEPIVGIVATATGAGYWLVAGDGGVFAFGDAPFWGSTGHLRLNAPVVSLSPTPSGAGYWMVASDGGVFAFGDAGFHGSMGGVPLNRPVNGMTRSPSGRGYRLVAADGGVFSFGDAPFYGSAAAVPPSSPLVGMSPTPSNNGYWLLTGDGGILAYGGADHLGDTRGRAAVSLTANPVAAGYRILLADGTTSAHGAAPGTGRQPVQPVQPPVSGPVGGFVRRSGSSLVVGGVPVRFTGINAYQLATDWSFNHGCGDSFTDAEVDAFFAGLPRDSMVRFWAFQHQAFNRNTGTIDFAKIDRVVRAAERHGQRLVVVLGNQFGLYEGHGQCDTPNVKDEAWYAGGYRNVHNDGTWFSSTKSARTTPLSYWDWIRLAVPRYAGSPAVAIWQPVNEPRPVTVSSSGSQTCSSTAAATLRQFFDTVGAEIKRLAPDQLVGTGLIGHGNCGAAGDQYQTLHASPAVDVASYHDYNWDTTPMPGDQWNGLQRRINQAAAVGKPIIVDEVGMFAGGSCMTLTQRRDRLAAKFTAQFDAGVSAILVWNAEKTGTSCSHDITPQDPTRTLITTTR